MTEKLNETNQGFSSKRGILVREDLEYSAQRLFTYSVVGLSAIVAFASVTYLIVVQLKK